MSSYWLHGAAKEDKTMYCNITEVEECDQCDRASSGREYGFKCEANQCGNCGDTYRDCEGSCNNGCAEAS